MMLPGVRWLAGRPPLACFGALLLGSGNLDGLLLWPIGAPLLIIGVFAAAAISISWLVFRVVGTLERRTVEQNRQLSALARIAAASARIPDLSELLATSLDHVMEVTGADAGVVCLLDGQAEELIASCYRGISEELARRIKRQKLADDPVGSAVVQTGKPVVLERLFDVSDTADIARRDGIRSAVSVPLRAGGEVSGVLAIASKTEKKFPPREVELLTSIGGQLGLAVRNAALYTKSQQRNRELSTLLAVGRAASSSLDVRALLDEALRAITLVSSGETAEVWRCMPNDELVLEGSFGASVPFHRSSILGRGAGAPGLAALTGAPVVIHDVAMAPEDTGAAMEALGYQTCVALPLTGTRQVLGVLVVAARSPDALSATTERRLMEGIGEQISMALENAKLHERVLDVAILEERERIARELHDGVGQVLGYINTQTLAIRKLLRSGQAVEAQEELQSMEDAARGVYADVREAILGLRTPFSKPGGLIPNLRTYVEQYAEMAGIPAKLDLDGTSDVLPLEPTCEIQIMRIIQEALANVRKHAHAGSVCVSVAILSGELEVIIADDGIGFDEAPPTRPSWPKFGVQTMRERAEAIGGRFALESERGRGTRVIVHAPVVPQEASVARPSG